MLIIVLFHKVINIKICFVTKGWLYYMKSASIKIQIESLEQQLRVLKSKIGNKKTAKAFSDLYGFFEGKMNFSLDEIKQHQYSLKGPLK